MRGTRRIMKLIVNCQLSIVMRGTRNPNAEEHPPSPPSKGGRAGRSVGGTGERLGVRPSASGGEPTEQRAGRKKIRLSEAKQVT